MSFKIIYAIRYTNSVVSLDRFRSFLDRIYGDPHVVNTQSTLMHFLKERKN